MERQIGSTTCSSLYKYKCGQPPVATGYGIYSCIQAPNQLTAYGHLIDRRALSIFIPEPIISFYGNAMAERR